MDALMNNYNRDVGAYIRDTVGLSMVEEGAYTRLLDQYYLAEMPFPNVKAELYRVARATTPLERKAVDYVVSKYFVLGADGWRQRRADAEMQSTYDKSESARASAERRWADHKAKALQTQCERTPDAMPQGCRLPKDWVIPIEWARWAARERQWTKEQVYAIADSFRDYWLTIPGPKGMKLDWEATWRGWVRRTRSASRVLLPNTPNARQTVADEIFSGKGRNGVSDITGESERLD